MHTKCVPDRNPDRRFIMTNITCSCTVDKYKNRSTDDNKAFAALSA